MAFVEFIQNGYHKIVNTDDIKRVFQTTSKRLDGSKYKNSPHPSEGDYVLFVECKGDDEFFAYVEELECVAAYEKIKAALAPVVIML